MTTAILAAVLFMIFTWIAFLNWMVFWRRHVQKRKAPSWIPLIGGLFGMAALWLVEDGGLRSFCWLPLLLDYGSAPGLVHTAAFHLVRLRGKG